MCIRDSLGGDDGRKLYDAVQKAIDKAKTLGADIIIGLGHLGVDPSSSTWTSEEVIANPTGFDAFIDGHSHTVMENKQVYDAAGKACLLYTSCLMRLDKEGNLTDYRFVKSIIRSRVKGVYSEINALLAGTADAEDVYKRQPLCRSRTGRRGLSGR